jgi:hypothetical protein
MGTEGPKSSPRAEEREGEPVRADLVLLSTTIRLRGC